MATVSVTSANFRAYSCNINSVAASPVSCRVRFGAIGSSYSNASLTLVVLKKKNARITLPNQRKIRAATEEGIGEENAETLNSQEDGGAAEQTTTVDQTVSVPVSLSDVLTMFFQAEGTMNETNIPKVKDALGKTEGINDLKVQVREGIASVELTKQTTVQATGVASGLVEIIQGSGFKLQTLNLSFRDDEDRK